MANHVPNPNAKVAILRSPEYSQGLAALDEVAPVESLDKLPNGGSRVDLVAGEGGIRYIIIKDFRCLISQKSAAMATELLLVFLI